MRFFYVWCFLLTGVGSALTPGRSWAANPTVTAGQLDLSTYNYRQDAPVSLAGEWLFHWNGYVDAATLGRQPQYLTQPGSWQPFTGGSALWPSFQGHATYGLRIRLPVAGQTWALKIPAVRRAYKLYVNGSLVAQVGTPGTSEATTEPGGGSRRAIFYVAGKEAFLLLHCANYHDVQGGPIYPFEFGTVAAVERKTLYEVVITAFFIGALLIMGLYHAGLYALGRRNTGAIFVCLLCLGAGFRELFGINTLFYILFPGVSWATAMKLLFVICCSCVVLLMLFLKNLFRPLVPRWFEWFVYSLNVGFGMFALFAPFDECMRLMPMIFPLSLLETVMFWLIVWQAWQQKREGSLILLIGMSILAVCFVNDILFLANWVYTQFLSSYGAFVLVCCLSMVLAQRFTNALARSEKLTAELQQANKAKAQLDQQRQAVEKKKALEDAKSRFLSNLTHEFRTPLTLIISPVDYWTAMHNDGEEIDPSILQLMFTTIRRNAHQLLRLINQLLDLSKLEAGSMQVVESRGDIRAFVGELVESFQLAAESRSIVLKYQAEPCPPLLLFDADKVEKILYNLLSNALKFTPGGGYVAVQLSAQPLDTDRTLLKMSVEDSGVGMSPDQVAHVFERFFMTNDTPVSLAGGSGIGLALVKELIETMGGTIGLTSEPGVGTTFTVEIPARQPDNVARPEAHVSSTVPVDEPPVLSDALIDSIGPLLERDRPVVLVVEDNADLQQFIANILGKQYLIRTAANGPEGWAMIYRDLPDVVVSDVMMPGLDGFELSRLIRETPRTSHIPVLLLTARTTVESRLEGLKAGANDYLAKPFHHQELQLRVASLLSQRRTANPEELDFDLNDIENNIFPAIRGRGNHPDEK